MFTFFFHCGRNKLKFHLRDGRSKMAHQKCNQNRGTYKESILETAMHAFFKGVLINTKSNKNFRFFK